MEEAGSSSPQSSGGGSPRRCNPEAPNDAAHDVIHSDNVGHTAYSKQWLLSALLKLAKFADDAVPQSPEEPASADSAASVDLSDAFQDELCQLWDMSMDAEVADFLDEYDAINILARVLMKAGSHRAVEIAIGILGNMACHSRIRERMASLQHVVDLSLMLLSSSDTPTLLESSRFLCTVLSCPSTRTTWLSAIEKSADVLQESIAFIFESSKNDELLQKIAQVVDILFDQSESICSRWIEVGLNSSRGRSVFLGALIEAMKQVGCEPPEAWHVFLHIMQLLTCVDSGAKAVVADGEPVAGLLLDYIEMLAADVLPLDEEHDTALASALSVLSVLVPASLLSCDQVITSLTCALRVLDTSWRPLETQLAPAAAGSCSSHESSSSRSDTSFTCRPADDTATLRRVRSDVAAALPGDDDVTISGNKRVTGQSAPVSDVAQPPVAADAGSGDQVARRGSSSDHRAALSAALHGAAYAFVFSSVEAAAKSCLNPTSLLPADGASERGCAGDTSTDDSASFVAVGDGAAAVAVLTFLDTKCSFEQLRDVCGALPCDVQVKLGERAQQFRLKHLIAVLREVQPT